MKLKALMTACTALALLSAHPALANDALDGETETVLVAEADADIGDLTANLEESSKARQLFNEVRVLYKAGYRRESTEAFSVLPLKVMEGYEAQNIVLLAITFKHKENQAEQILALTFRPLFGHVLPREILGIEKMAKATSKELKDVNTLSDELVKDGQRGAQLKGLMADLKASGFEPKSGSTAGMLKLGETTLPETFEQFCAKTTLVNTESGESLIVALQYKVTGSGPTAKKDLRKVLHLKPLSH